MEPDAAWSVGETKRQRIALLKRVFGTSSKTAIEGVQLEFLQAGLKLLRKDLALPAASDESELAAGQRIGAALAEDLGGRGEAQD